MKIFLKELAKHDHKHQVTLPITERLPAHIASCKEFFCTIRLDATEKDYSLLTLEVDCEIDIICQRCMQVFPYHYQNASQLAVCQNEQVCDKLIANYDCILSDRNSIDLTDIVTDDLYLYVPEKHQSIESCDTNYVIS